MLAVGEIVRGFGICHFAGVFDARMIRIYKAISSCPEILGSEGDGRQKISVVLWSFSEDAYAKVAHRLGIAPELSRLWDPSNHIDAPGAGGLRRFSSGDCPGATIGSRHGQP